MKQPETMIDASSHARELRRRRVRLIVVAVFVSACSVACILYFGFDLLIPTDTNVTHPESVTSNTLSERASRPAPDDGANVAMPSPDLTPTSTPTPSAVAANPFAEYNELARRNGGLETSPPFGASGNLSGASQLLIPVAGISKEQLIDTFTAVRSEGRTHNALDIIAPHGTPVLAATDGRLLRKFTSVKGGLAIYQIGTDERTIYYYAHLDRYAEGLSDNQMLRRGDVIGYVGDTGNSGVGNYHLHFAVWVVIDPKRFYDGENINPYPLLTR